MAFRLDKAQLTCYTSEICFEPLGYFRIQSKGNVYELNGNITSKHKIFATVKIAEIGLRRRHSFTTQRKSPIPFESLHMSNTHNAIASGDKFFHDRPESRGLRTLKAAMPF